MDEERYARQVLAFGEEGQQRIAEAQVGIVGLGGLGSHIAQGLTYLGVRSFVLVDDDSVEPSNLNRLIGGEPQDAAALTKKVEVAARTIHRIAPEADVRAIPLNLRSRGALEALIECPVIFGCVDQDAPRLILTELAAAYERILIDSATEIILRPDTGRIAEVGGRVVLARPGDYCLVCADQIDMEQAKWELASPEERAERTAHGYGLGEQVPSPAVVSLNGTVANLAITEFLHMQTTLCDPRRKFRYVAYRENDPQCGKVIVSQDSRKEGCYTCGYLVGQREAAKIFRYVPSE